MPRITTPPGEILQEEFMSPHNLSANALARALDVPANRITGILNGDRGLTPDTALRLARYFDMTPEFWLNLQQAHDLSKADVEVGARIKDTVRPLELV
jgi:antitoxin HigA-1